MDPGQVPSRSPVPLNVLLGPRRLAEVPDEAADHGIAPLSLAVARPDSPAGSGGTG
ncbi:MAG: hypothetical protein M3Y33_12030 [Actinomycetota bacterium]|nr:hypothetical protein [Actinomycetota bacterium]